MSAQILNLQYFDDGKGIWGLRRPKNISPQPQGDRPTYNMVHLNLGISSQLTPEERVKALVGQYLSPVEPTFVTLTEVTHEVSAALTKNSWIRSNYAMTDSVFCIGPALTEAAGPDAKEMEIEQACIILIRHGVNVDFVESLAKQHASHTTDNEPQPIVAIHMRNFLGLGFHTLCVLHADPTTELKGRIGYLNPLLERLAEKDNVIVSANFYQQNAMAVKDFKLKLHWEKSSTDFTDVTDSANCTKALNQNPQESSIWYRFRDSRLIVDKAQLLSLDANAPNVYQSAVVCRFAANPSYSALSTSATGSPTGGTTPVPAKAQPQAPQTVSASPQGSQATQFADPAVMSMRNNGSAVVAPNAVAVGGARGTYSIGAAEGGVNLANLFSKANAGVGAIAPASLGAPNAMGATRLWSVSKLLAMNRRTVLGEMEKEMDLSSKFGSVVQAVEQLNSGAFPYNRDYVVVHSTLLACSTAHCSLEAFRKYSLAYSLAPLNQPNSVDHRNTTPGSISGTPNSALAAFRGSFQNSQSPEPNVRSGFNPQLGPSMGVDRPRVWAASSAVLVHQVTPKEMVFDISADVGLGSGSLKKGVDKLNSASSGRRPDPAALAAGGGKDRLAHYRYDYALLFNRERGAYWLLAALDVPCDIQACRASITQVTPQPL